MGVPVPVTPSGPRGRLGQPGAGGGESQEGLPAAFSAWSQRPSERSVCLVSQIQTALRHKSEIEHHRNKIRLRAKRRGHYEFPVLDELSSGDTRERHRVLPQGADADRQDPGPHGQRALCVHRAQEEVGPEPGRRPLLQGYDGSAVEGAGRSLCERLQAG